MAHLKTKLIICLYVAIAAREEWTDGFVLSEHLCRMEVRGQPCAFVILLPPSSIKQEARL